MLWRQQAAFKAPAQGTIGTQTVGIPPIVVYRVPSSRRKDQHGIHEAVEYGFAPRFALILLHRVGLQGVRILRHRASDKVFQGREEAEEWVVPQLPHLGPPVEQRQVFRARCLYLFKKLVKAEGLIVLGYAVCISALGS